MRRRRHLPQRQPKHVLAPLARIRLLDLTGALRFLFPDSRDIGRIADALHGYAADALAMFDTDGTIRNAAVVAPATAALRCANRLIFPPIGTTRGG